MELISVSILKPGEKLAKSIRTQDGKILLPSSTMLTSEFIRILEESFVTNAYISSGSGANAPSRACLSEETKLYAFAAIIGAYNAISIKKPINTNLIKNASRKIILDVVGAMKTGAIGLSNLLAVDDCRFLHAINTGVIVAALALKLSYNAGQIEDFTTAALLHDIFITNLNDDKDWSHALTAKKYLKDMKEYGVRTYMSVAMHHENYDGTGLALYQGERIVDGARMIAVADCFDGLIYGHSGFDKLSVPDALNRLSLMSGKKLDPAFVETLKGIIGT